MMYIYKLLATGLGIGYFRKGSGTIAAAVCCVAWYFTHADGFGWTTILVTTMLIGLGIWCATMVESEWGVDSNRVVIDEIAGMSVSLLLLPVTVPYLLAGFVLFRFFDIVKPFFIRKLESLPGGWGVMMDDVLAGLYTNVILQLIFHFKLL